MCCLAAMSPRSMRLASSDLLLGAQQRHAADRAQVQAQRVEARLDRQVDLGRFSSSRRARSPLGLIVRLAVLRRPLASSGSSPPRSSVRLARVESPPWRSAGVACERIGPLARLDDLDAVLLEVAEQLVGLLARELGLLERSGDRSEARNPRS